MRGLSAPSQRKEGWINVGIISTKSEKNKPEKEGWISEGIISTKPEKRRLNK